MKLKRHGKYRDGSPNDVPVEVPPFDKLLETQRWVGVWMYRQRHDGDFVWELIASKPQTLDQAVTAAKSQCETWGIPFVERQWAFVETVTTTTRRVLTKT